MPASFTTINNILKELYTSPVVRQLNDEILLLQRLDSSSSEVEVLGKYAVVPVNVGRTGGVGDRPEFGTLPSTGNQRFLRATYNLVYKYAQIGLSGPSIAASSKDSGAFLRVLKSEVDGATMDLKKDCARQIYGDGTGAIVPVTSLTSGGGTATIVVVVAQEVIDKGQLYVGMNVDIGTLANPVLRNPASSYGTISAITVATNSVTILSASGANFGTPAGTDFLFRQGNAAASSVSYEMSGLQGLVSTTAATIFGTINPATAGQEAWDAQRSTSASVSQDALQQLWAKVRRGSGEEPSLLIGSYGFRRQYFNTLQSQVRYQTPTKLSGGFEALDFNGLPLVADHEAPYGKAYFLNESHLKIYAINAQGGTDFAWMNLDGAVLSRVANQDAYQAVLHRYLQLGTDKRDAHGVMSGFTDTGY